MTVDNARELLNNIGSDTVIKLEPGVYDIADAVFSRDGKVTDVHFSTMESDKNYMDDAAFVELTQLKVDGVKKLRIEGAGAVVIEDSRIGKDLQEAPFTLKNVDFQ